MKLIYIIIPLVSVLNILTYPDPFLKTKAKPVDAVDDSVRVLIDDMVETMRSARGIGLAATQVGDERRVIVLDVPEEEDDGEEEGERRDSSDTG